MLPATRTGVRCGKYTRKNGNDRLGSRRGNESFARSEGSSGMDCRSYSFKCLPMLQLP